MNSICKNSITAFIKTAIVIFSVVITFGYVFYRVLLLNPTSYYASRILYFSSLDTLLATDSSTFIRIGYLILHLLIFKDHPVLGIGGGSFNYMFADYTMKYYPLSARLDEVGAHVSMRDAGTTVSTYFSVFSEFGIVGVCLFGSFLIKSIRRVKFLKANNTAGILVFISVCLALPIQFGSWAFVIWWIGLGILDGIKHA